MPDADAFVSSYNGEAALTEGDCIIGCCVFPAKCASCEDVAFISAYTAECHLRWHAAAPEWDKFDGTLEEVVCTKCAAGSRPSRKTFSTRDSVFDYEAHVALHEAIDRFSGQFCLVYAACRCNVCGCEGLTWHMGCAADCVNHHGAVCGKTPGYKMLNFRVAKCRSAASQCG